MEPLGDDDLISIFEKLDNKNDRKSFYRVSKQFLKVACIRLKNLHISLPDVLKDILLPNMARFGCSKPLSNTYMELLARSSPNLRNLHLDSAQDIDPQKEDSKEVGNLKNSLIGLDLCECDRISDAGIFYLKELCCLKYLNLSKCGVNVTDTGAVALSRIPNIEILDMSWLSSITNISLCEIASKYLKLKSINLSGCQAITGEGFRAFAHHPTLRSLTLLSCHNISFEDVQSVVLTWTGWRRIFLSKSMEAQMILSNRIFDYDHLCRVSWI